MNTSAIKEKIRQNDNLYFHINTTQFMDLIPIDIGYAKSKEWEISEEYPYFLLHYILCGTACIEINNKKYYAKKDQMFLIPPNCKVKYYNAKKTDISFLWLNFSGLKCHDAINLTAFKKSYVIDVSHKKEIVNTLFECLNNCNESILQNFSPYSTLYYVINLLVSENLNNVEGLTKTKNNNFQSILNTINKHIFDKDLSVKYICKIHYISQEYFSRLFTKNMGTNFSSYVALERIKKACSLLEKYDLPIKTVASQVGFSDVYYFYKVFKKYRLTTPTRYRLSQAQKHNKSLS